MKFCLLSILLWSGILAAQPVKLTQSELLEDFAFLQKTINDYAVFVPLAEKRMGIFVNAHLEALKQEITPGTSLEEFANIVRHGLNILYDGHSGFCQKDAIKWNITSEYSYLKKVSNAVLDDTLYASYYASVVTDSIYKKTKNNLLIKYADGKYHTISPFTMNGVSIKAGEVVSAINGVPVDTFINNLFPKLYMMCWDPQYKKLYTDALLTSLAPAGYNTCTFTIAGKEVFINTQTKIPDLKRPDYTLPRSALVTVLDNDILYIRMPMMMNYGWYVKEIRQAYNPQIKKVVFDLRQNGGGDDSVWAIILSQLLRNPLHYTYRVEMNYHEDLKDAIAGFGNIEVKGDKMTVERKRVITPDSSSVGFDGPIYILQGKNTYSAASAFISAAKQNKKIFTIAGEPSAMISGYTFPGIVFVLPHSRIAYKLAFSADVSGEADDPYRDQVDILITENINDYLERSFIYDPQELNFLLKRDKCIKYIKEL